MYVIKNQAGGKYYSDSNWNISKEEATKFTNEDSARVKANTLNHTGLIDGNNFIVEES